ncbi:hypothetical protein CDL12_16476 [Handroanthus impetiginosus]|uniref:AP2/ERF domain-containing protein n=1 Tax=Handroanthus impetiginosus TaxID=429701 RepID=A0A2G9H080_9LAMI|nr:hypothetical protein CDL12_16476 [Handroanthus impetiginosus]
MVKSPEKQLSSSAAASSLQVVREAAASSSSSSSSPSTSSSCKYKGVRKRKWGKFVSEIRLPNCRERIWLGSYDTAEKAARAFDAALFCLRGRNAKFNFPGNPPDIVNGGSMTPAEIQAAAARFAHASSDPPAAGPSGRFDNLDSQSDSLSSSEVLQHAESPCPSVSYGAAQLDNEVTEIPLDNAFLDQFLNMGTENNVQDFGLFPGFDDFSGDFMSPLLPNGNADYWQDNSDEMSSEDPFLWSF